MTCINGQSIALDAEFRPRTEIRQGFRAPLPKDLSAAFITTQRTRLNARFSSGNVTARLSFQDARIYGNSNNKVNVSKVEMYEGWFERFIKPRLFLKMGRQTLSYDDQRLFAAPNWSCTGMAHDVLLVKFKGEKFNYHTGFAYNNLADALFNADYMYSNSQNYKALAFSWFEVPIKGSVVLSGIGVVDFFEEAEDYNRLSSRITYGGNLIYKNDTSNLEGSLAVYFQAGKTPHKVSGSGYSDLKAFLLAANVCFLSVIS